MYEDQVVYMSSLKLTKRLKDERDVEALALASHRARLVRVTEGARVRLEFTLERWGRARGLLPRMPHSKQLFLSMRMPDCPLPAPSHQRAAASLDRVFWACGHAGVN